jgi:hypothetical protein
LHEDVQFLIILVCQSMLLHGVQVLQMLGCSNSVLLYCTGWLQSSIRMILRVRFVRGFPVSNNISVSKCVSPTGCPGSDNNRVSSTVLSCSTGWL